MKAVLVAVIFVLAVGVVDLRAAEPEGISASASAVVSEAPPGWRSDEALREDLSEGLSLGVSFWWLLGCFILAAALLVWLAYQQNRGGRFFGGQAGRENIDVVARRMFGSRHGVVCVRLRDREFLLGIGGDNVSLISEWRTRERTDGEPAAPSFEKQIADNADGNKA